MERPIRRQGAAMMPPAVVGIHFWNTIVHGRTTRTRINVIPESTRSTHGLMKRILFIISVSFFVFSIGSALSQSLDEVQPPHDDTNGIGCSDCHVPFGTAPDPVPDNWITENVCWSCHTEAGVAQFQNVHTIADTVWCQACHNPHQHQDEFPENYIKDYILTPNSGGRQLAFRNASDHIHGDPGVSVPYDGICETCHTQTDHHRNDGSAPAQDHNNATNCIACHPHDNGFMPSMTGASHSTHLTAAHGPEITCSGCHSANPPEFSDGQNLANTTVCDVCHGVDGAFDGVNDPDFGAKANWADGVYDGLVLASGKEKWCAGCHDQGISVVNGVQAPPIAGDDSNWGYFTTGHGQNDLVNCTQCHDMTMPHTDGETLTYSAASDNYQVGFRLLSVNGGPPLDVPRSGTGGMTNPYDDPPYWDQCFQCHDKHALLGGPTAGPGPYNSPVFQTNFRGDASVIIDDGFGSDIAGYSTFGAVAHNSHYRHLLGPPTAYDTDRDGAIDSYGTCVSCHNVHGSSSASMIRDGKLIGIEPSLNFSHVRYDRHNPASGPCPNGIIMTSDGVQPSVSVGGVMRTNSGPATNGICNFCHCGGAATGDPEYEIDCYGPDCIDYYRVFITTPTPSSGP